MQTKKFKRAIMREYLRYKRNPIGEFGFPFFGVHGARLNKLQSSLNIDWSKEGRAMYYERI